MSELPPLQVNMHQLDTTPRTDTFLGSLGKAATTWRDLKGTLMDLFFVVNIYHL